MTNFQNSWSKPTTPSVSEKLGDVLKPKGALKPRIEQATRSLQNQISKLDGMLTKLKQREEKLFQRVVQATQKHDTHTSKVLANELAEVRKVTKMLGNCRMALEQIELRLTTFHDLGDTVVTIAPTIGLMRSLKSSLGKFMPEADHELGMMTEMLNGLMAESFSGEGAFGMDQTTNEESERILEEAAAVAEASVGDKFPSTPVSSKTATSTRYL
jgi:division protein CdvB (Snf7/Vps24/ESCRT-III family)